MVEIGPFDIELVPKGSWNKNLYHLLSRSQWEKIRKRELERAGYKCEICGYEGKHLNCHEIWEYDDENKIQRLVGYKILCPKCHLAYHLGFAMAIGKFNETIDWICKLSKLKKKEVMKLVDKVFENHTRRSQFEWTIDLSYEGL